MKFSLLLMVSMFTATASQAQRKHRADDQIHSLNWDIIGSTTFELDDKNLPVPKFGEMIKRFNNRNFGLTGYLIPVKSGRKHLTFLISPLPINQCFYCGQNGIPSMVMVTVKEAIPYIEKPITVNGLLVLSGDGHQPPIALKDAEIIVY